MRKPPYLSNKKWNKKFQKNVKKFQNLANPLTEDRINKLSEGSLVDNSLGTKLLQKCTLFFLCLLSFVRKTVSYILVKFTQISTGMNNHKAQETTTIPTTPILEVRLGDLEKTLKEYVEIIESLKQQVAEHTERIVKLTDQQKPTSTELFSKSSHFQMAQFPTPSAQSVVPLPASVTSFSSVAPPPPPPPPPPMGLLSVQNQLVIRKPSTVKKPSQKPQMLRPAISLEDIISVKLKKTPFAQRNERTTTSNELPRISLEALRSVKLKKTSRLLLKETSPVKSKSPKGKIRHVLRRLPITLSPGGTPKGGRSNVISDQDDMTPVMTRALLKRFDAFQMSPDSEENKENDMQFI